VALTPDGRRAVISCYSSLRSHIEAGVELLALPAEEFGCTSIAITADGRRTVFGCRDGMVRLWDTDTGREVQKFQGHNRKVGSVAVTPHGRWIISGSLDWTLRLWDTETGECLATFTGDAAITCVAVARDDLFVAGSANGAIHILELRGPSAPTP
jgi:WD40 repeat protein